VAELAFQEGQRKVGAAPARGLRQTTGSAEMVTVVLDRDGGRREYNGVRP
jgi:hypothetical protein